MNERADIFIALRVDCAEAPLHITLTFIEASSEEERRAVWFAYKDLLAPHLPMHFKTYGTKRVGLNDELEAMDVLPRNLDLELALEERYEKTVRRAHKRFNQLNWHVTLNSEAKRAAVKKLGGYLQCSTLYMREVGGDKNVLAQAGVDSAFASFEAFDEITQRPADEKARATSAPKGARKQRVARESGAKRRANVVSGRRARRAPQRFKPKH